MTLINKIRERTGLMIGIIAVALGLFVLGDLFSSGGSAIFQDNSRIVGEIGGEEITLEEFTAEYERIRTNYAMSTGQNPPESILPSIRQQAWNQLIFKVAYRQECEKLGLEVTDAEMVDMVQGNNIHPGVASSFTNPETGEVDRTAIQNFLANLDQYDPSAQASWYNFESSLGPDRLKSKYEGLLTNTFYATKAEAKREYRSKNASADLKYVYVPFSSVADSTITVTDADLSAYFNKNKEEFEGTANVELEYLSFSLRATAEDIAAIKAETDALRTAFIETQNDTAFVEANSDGSSNFQLVSPANLPTELTFENNLDGLEKGKVYGPYNAGQEFRMFKVIDIRQDTVPSARARHILFKVEEGETDSDALARANEVLRQIKNGADFGEMAKEHGTDGTKDRGGDLGWFAQGTMVDEFNEAVMNATEPGLLPRPVKTQFGYHLIEVVNTKTFDQFLIGTILKEITPSDETIDRVYRQAGRFTQYETRDALSNNLDSGMVLYQALTVPPTARNINNLTGNRVRQIVTWAYGDAKVGEISDIFDLDDQFVIAVLNKRTEKGEATLEDVKEQVKQAVIKEKKKEIIANKLKELGGTIDEISSAYGTGATVYTANQISLASPSITGAGFAPEIVGAAFGLEVGKRSAPVASANGVAIVELTNLNEAMEVADYSAYKNDVVTRYSGSAQFKITQAIEKLYDVEEKLYKYY